MCVGCIHDISWSINPMDSYMKITDIGSLVKEQTKVVSEQ